MTGEAKGNMETLSGNRLPFSVMAPFAAEKKKLYTVLM